MKSIKRTNESVRLESESFFLDQQYESVFLIFQKFKDKWHRKSTALKDIDQR